MKKNDHSRFRNAAGKKKLGFEVKSNQTLCFSLRFGKYLGHQATLENPEDFFANILGKSSLRKIFPRAEIFLYLLHRALLSVLFQISDFFLKPVRNLGLKKRRILSKLKKKTENIIFPSRDVIPFFKLFLIENILA